MVHAWRSMRNLARLSQLSLLSSADKIKVDKGCDCMIVDVDPLNDEITTRGYFAFLSVN